MVKATQTISGTQPPLDNEKQRARERWEQDPCGAVYGRDHQFGTREFFDEVERQRYQEYAPWMPAVMGFDQYPGSAVFRWVILPVCSGEDGDQRFKAIINRAV